MRIPEKDHTQPSSLSGNPAVGNAAIGQTGAARLYGASGTPSTGTPTDGDDIQISDLGRLLQSLSSNHTAKLQQLSEAVRTGTYSIPAKDLSRSLVTETLARHAG